MILSQKNDDGEVSLGQEFEGWICGCVYEIESSHRRNRIILLCRVFLRGWEDMWLALNTDYLKRRAKNCGWFRVSDIQKKSSKSFATEKIFFIDRSKRERERERFSFKTFIYKNFTTDCELAFVHTLWFIICVLKEKDRKRS